MSESWPIEEPLAWPSPRQPVSTEFIFNVPLPIRAARLACVIAEAGSHVPSPVKSRRPASIVTEAERPMPMASTGADDASHVSMLAMLTEIMKTATLRSDSWHVPVIFIHREVLKATSHMEGAHACVKARTSPSHGVARAEENSAEANSNGGYDGFRLHSL
jgi:hypothetical protein